MEVFGGSRAVTSLHVSHPVDTPAPSWCRTKVRAVRGVLPTPTFEGSEALPGRAATAARRSARKTRTQVAPIPTKDLVDRVLGRHRKGRARRQAQQQPESLEICPHLRWAKRRNALRRSKKTYQRREQVCAKIMCKECEDSVQGSDALHESHAPRKRAETEPFVQRDRRRVPRVHRARKFSSAEPARALDAHREKS